MTQKIIKFSSLIFILVNIISCLHKSTPNIPQTFNPSNKISISFEELDLNKTPLQFKESKDSQVFAQELEEAYKENWPEIEKWINYFTKKNTQYLARALKRGTPYQPFVEKILKKYDVPKELFYLPVIESCWQTKAISSAGAQGPWQFMKGTAKNYHLKVNSFVDERRDPLRSTIAAAQYLRSLYNVFHSWLLAISAYNAGENRVLRAIMTAKKRSFWQLSKRKKLPPETRNYVPKFLAVLYLLEQKNLSSIRKKPIPHLISARVPGGYAIKTLAKALQLSPQVISKYNPHLLKGVTPPLKNKYRLWVPERVKQNIKKLSYLKAKKPQRRPKRLSYKIHRVRKGESFYRIAKKYNFNIRELKKVNKIRSNILRPGQRLKIPYARKKVVSRRYKKRRFYYRVSKGDNLFKISKKFKTSIHLLKKTNRLKSSRIYIGQLLTVKAKG